MTLVVLIVLMVAVAELWRRGFRVRWPRGPRRSLRDLRVIRLPPAGEPGFGADDARLGDRAELLDFLADRVTRLPALPARGSCYIDVLVHPHDRPALESDLIGVEEELNRLLRGRIGCRVRVRRVSADVLSPGQADARLVAADGRLTRTQVLTGVAEPAHREPPPPRPGPVRPPRLVLIAEGGGTRLVVPPAGGVLGRDAQVCQLVVDDPGVSRRHVELRPDRAGCVVRDLGSANGTTVNSRPAGQGVLRPGDVLGVGRTVRLRLTVESR